MSHHGAPAYLCSYSGPEFVSRAILQCFTGACIQTAIIEARKPQQNRTNESLNGKLRDDCFGIEWFRTSPPVAGHHRSLATTTRPHSSLSYLTT
jgi:putative transposase